MSNKNTKNNDTSMNKSSDAPSVFIGSQDAPEMITGTSKDITIRQSKGRSNQPS